MSRKNRARVPVVDAAKVFENTVVAMVRESGYGRRFTSDELDVLVKAMVTEFGPSLEEFSEYLEREDWDGLVMLAARERTRAQMRATRMGGVPCP
jgi:hypothetical protein